MKTIRLLMMQFLTMYSIFNLFQTAAAVPEMETTCKYIVLVRFTANQLINKNTKYYCTILLDCCLLELLAIYVKCNPSTTFNNIIFKTFFYYAAHFQKKINMLR
jgi:hypothetical protein